MDRTAEPVVVELSLGQADPGSRVRLATHGGAGCTEFDAAPGLTPGLLRQLARSLGRAPGPWLVLGGPLAQQLSCLPKLAELRTPGPVRIALRASCDDRPVLIPEHQTWSWLDALILDAAPNPAEASNWRRAIGADIEQRVLIERPAAVAVDRPRARRLRAALDLPAGSTLLALVTRRPGPWTALALHAFQLWALGRYSRCGCCRAHIPWNLRPEGRAPLAPRACPWCGGETSAGSARADLGLLIGRHGSELSALDPSVLANWLQIDGQVRVIDAGADPGWDPAELFAATDAAVVLGDPAFDDPLLETALTHAPRVLSNLWRERPPAHLVQVENPVCGWDPQGHATSAPGLAELLRGLESLGARPAAEPPPVDPDPAPAGAGLASRLAQVPPRGRFPGRMRGRRPRSWRLRR